MISIKVNKMGLETSVYLRDVHDAYQHIHAHIACAYTIDLDIIRYTRAHMYVQYTSGGKPLQ